MRPTDPRRCGVGADPSAPTTFTGAVIVAVSGKQYRLVMTVANYTGPKVYSTPQADLASFEMLTGIAENVGPGSAGGTLTVGPGERSGAIEMDLQTALGLADGHVSGRWSC